MAEEKNLALLADAVGLEITVDETESKVGDFNVDIYATETGTERRIIIENQLEDTNHDHLGKLITYASGKGADIVIWIVKRAREEHRAAIEWLNNHTDENISFFLIEIKLYKIGNSDPAVKFEIIEKPNDWTKEVKKQSTNAPAQQFRLEYWTAFNNYAFANKAFAKEFKQRKPSTNHWMSFSIGSSACGMSILRLQQQSQVGVELYIMTTEGNVIHYGFMQIAAGVPLVTVAGRAGHARTSTTTDIYSHFLKSSDKTAAEKLEQLFE